MDKNPTTAKAIMDNAMEYTDAFEYMELVQKVSNGLQEHHGNVEGGKLLLPLLTIATLIHEECVRGAAEKGLPAPKSFDYYVEVAKGAAKEMISNSRHG